MRKWIGALVVLGVTLGSSSAFAQMENFGKKGSVGLSAERLFALFYTAKLSLEDGQGRSHNHSYSGVGFGWAANSAYDPFNTPRFGIDYFVIDSLSIGGGLGYAKFTDDDGNADYTQFLLAPRVGYWIPIGGVVGFWPRGGFTYHSRDPDGDNNNESGLALTLEGMFGIGPVEHFAFLVGPTLDLDFIGSHQCNGAAGREDDCKWRYSSFGIQVGLMGWL
jgi:hypothetical protein